MSATSQRTSLLSLDSAPTLSLKERDRRWHGLQQLMRERGLDAIVVGSFRGRELYESYLIDDFLDSIVILPESGDAVMLTISTGRVSRVLESQRRGFEPWVKDMRIGARGRDTADLLTEMGLDKGRIGLVGFGPTAPGEMDGLIPLGFWRGLTSVVSETNIEDFTRDFTDFVLIKSDEELSLLRYAAQVSDAACESMVQACRPGASEAEVYADIMHTIYSHGCDVRYPFLSLQSGPENIAWGAPRWLFRAERPRILQKGDLVQAEIHTCYGGQEAQVQMSVAIDPIDQDTQLCEEVAYASYQAGLNAVRPGVLFADVVKAMEDPIKKAGCWSKTPLLHTLTFGSTGFTPVNRDQLVGTSEEWLEANAEPGIRRPDLVLQPGMCLELEPNACIRMKRVNVGAAVVVTKAACVELNQLPTRVRHVSA